MTARGPSNAGKTILYQHTSIQEYQNAHNMNINGLPLIAPLPLQLVGHANSESA